MSSYILKGTVLEIINSSALASDSVLKDCCSVTCTCKVWSQPGASAGETERCCLNCQKKAKSSTSKIRGKVESFYTWKSILELEIKIMCFPQSSREFKKLSKFLIDDTVVLSVFH